MAAIAAEAGAASRSILKMLISFSSSSIIADRRQVLEFVAETVAGYIEDESPMSHDEALVLLQDAGLADIDDDDLNGLTSAIEILTSDGQSADADEEEEEGIDDGACDLCERIVNRTFHHLIPKETHNRYLSKKRLPANITQGECTRLWLNTNGINI